jgi:hypothetical protein
MSKDEDIQRIDRLIGDFGGSGFLFLEHLHAARRFRLSSALGEYSLSLRQAKESVGCIPDKAARADAMTALRNLIGEIMDRPVKADAAVRPPPSPFLVEPA